MLLSNLIPTFRLLFVCARISINFDCFYMEMGNPQSNTLFTSQRNCSHVCQGFVYIYILTSRDGVYWVHSPFLFIFQWIN
jgi:hypothetical protein